MPGAEKTVSVRGVANFQGVTAEVRRASRQFSNLTKEMERANMRASRLTKTMNTFFRASAVVGSIYAMTRGLRVLTENAGQTEAALAGISKTTEIVGADLTRLGNRILDASVQMGSARIEMLNVAKVAGQLGINGARDLAQFTIAITKLAEATNLTAEEGATNLARFLFLTGNETVEIDRVASSIVHLGNNVAATESEILRMATAIAQTTAPLELNDRLISGWAATTAAAGLRVESTSNAIFRFLEGIKRAGTEGGTALRGLAEALDLSIPKVQELIATDLDEFIKRLIPALATVDSESVTNLLYALGIDDIRTHRSINTTIQQERARGAFTRNVGLAASQDSRAEALNTEFQRQRNTLLRDIEAINQRVGISMERMSSVIVERLLPSYETLADALEGLSRVINPIISTIGFLLSALPLGVGTGLFVGLRGLSRAGLGTGSVLRASGTRARKKSRTADEFEDEADRLAVISTDPSYSANDRRKAILQASDNYVRALQKTTKNLEDETVGRAYEEVLERALERSLGEAYGNAIKRGVSYGLIGGTIGGGLQLSHSLGQGDILNRRDASRAVGGFASEAHFLRFTEEAVRRVSPAGATEEALAVDIDNLRLAIKDLEDEIRRNRMIAEAQDAGFNLLNSIGAWFNGQNFYTGSPMFDEVNPVLDHMDQVRAGAGLADPAVRRALITESLRATPLEDAREYGQLFLPGVNDTEREKAVKQRRRLLSLEKDLLGYQRERHTLLMRELEYGEEITGDQRDYVANSRRILEMQEEMAKNAARIEEIAGFGDNTEQGKERAALQLTNEGLLLQVNYYTDINRQLELSIELLEARTRRIAKEAQAQAVLAAQEATRLKRVETALKNLGTAGLSPTSIRIDDAQQTGIETGRRLDEQRQFGGSFAAQQAAQLQAMEMVAENTGATTEEVKRLQADFDRIYGVLQQGIAHPLQRWFEGKSLGEALGESLMSIRNELISTWFVNPIVDSMDEVIRQVAGGALGLSENGFASAFDVNAAGADIKINMTSGQVTLNGLGLDSAGNLKPQGGGESPFNLGGIIKDSFLSTITGGISDFFGGGSPAPIDNQFSQIGSGSRAARGGIARRGGLTLVGEQGAEIVRLPTGAEVYPSGSMPADMAGSVQINNYYTINARDGNDIREVLEQERPRLLRDAKQAVVRDMGKRASKLSNATAAAAGA